VCVCLLVRVCVCVSALLVYDEFVHDSVIQVKPITLPSDLRIFCC